MSGVYLLLIAIGAFGFLPLMIILYKKKRVKRVLTTGERTTATVYRIYKSPRQATDIVYYSFYTQNTSQSTGTFTIRAGVYKQGDTLDVYYLPSNPRRNTVQGAWGSNFMVAFGVAIAAFVLFAVYKLYEEIQAGRM